MVAALIAEFVIRKWSPPAPHFALPKSIRTFGIPLITPENPAQFERISDQRMNGVPVLNVEEIDSLTEYLRLVVFLYS